MDTGLGGHNRARDRDAIVDMPSSRGRARGPFFAEEFLHDATKGCAIPVDIKVYTFYGEIGHVALRRVGRYRQSRSVQWRYVTPDGAELGDIAYGCTVSSDVPVPPDLANVVDVAALLSKLSRCPSFGSICTAPHVVSYLVNWRRYPAPHSYGIAQSATSTLGELWEDAEVRLATDIRHE